KAGGYLQFADVVRRPDKRPHHLAKCFRVYRNAIRHAVLSLGYRGGVELRAWLHVLKVAMEIKAVPVFTRHLRNGRHRLLLLQFLQSRIGVSPTVFPVAFCSALAETDAVGFKLRDPGQGGVALCLELLADTGNVLAHQIHCTVPARFDDALMLRD
ncbi:hypothetical protein APB65_03200, partial [Pseudomonas aeruginosa]